MRLKPFFKTTLYLGFALSAFTLASPVFASAFQIWEQSEHGVGDYHAGAAAEGDNAGDEFYNPASIIRLKHTQISAGAAVIPVKSTFNGEITQLGQANQVSNLTTNTTNVIPNIHLVIPFADRFAFSFGVEVPFGLETNYPSSFIDNTTGTVQPNQAATLTQLETINLNPSIAYALTNKLSIGVGFDALYGKATYNNELFFDPTTAFNNTLNGWAMGYNLGALYQFTPSTRLGASYRSSMTIPASGTSSLTSAPSQNTSVSTNFSLPGTAIASLYHDFNQKWSVLGSAFWTSWNHFSNIDLYNTSLLPAENLVVNENYKNTWNFALGLHYRVIENLALKLGGGYDQTPTQTGERDIRLPDVSRYALALGFEWSATKKLDIESGYVHLFTPNHQQINNSQADANSTGLIPVENGQSSMSANVFGAQLSWKFC